MYAADLDPVGVACARRNLAPRRVFEGDLYDALPTELRGRVDVLVANAPYVPTDAIATMPPEARDHEPRVALDGGGDGLDVQRRIIAEAPRRGCAPGGHLLIETGRSQAAGTVAACARRGAAGARRHRRRPRRDDRRRRRLTRLVAPAASLVVPLRRSSAAYTAISSVASPTPTPRVGRPGQSHLRQAAGQQGHATQHEAEKVGWSRGTVVTDHQPPAALRPARCEPQRCDRDAQRRRTPCSQPAAAWPKSARRHVRRPRSRPVRASTSPSSAGGDRPGAQLAHPFGVLPAHDATRRTRGRRRRAARDADDPATLERARQVARCTGVTATGRRRRRARVLQRLRLGRPRKAQGERGGQPQEATPYPTSRAGRVQKARRQKSPGRAGAGRRRRSDAPPLPSGNGSCRCPSVGLPVNDGPLIVQSDKTLPARDRPRARRRLPQGDRAVRRARALPRARAHLPAHPARSLERPRRRPRRRAGRRHAAGVQPVRRPARAARRRRRDDGPLRPAAPGEAPDPRPGAGLQRPAGPRGGAARQEDRRHARRPDRRRHRRRARLRARQPQAGAAQAGLAGRGLRRVRRRRGAPDRARRDRVAPARLPARGRRVVLARRVRRRRAPLRRRQDAGRRGRDGPRAGDHADPGHQHRVRAAVEGRAGPAYVADRGGDRRVLRRGQGDPAGHHRDVPGDDHPAEGRLLRTSSCSTPATGG